MNNAFNRLHGVANPSTIGGGIAVLTAKKFLGKDGGPGYYSTEQFLAFAKSLREAEIEQYEQAFDCMKEGLRTSTGIVTRRDKGNRAYTYLSFVKLRANVGLKFIIEGGMKEMLQDYQNGKIAVSFTFEELIEEAMND